MRVSTCLVLLLLLAGPSASCGTEPRGTAVLPMPGRDGQFVRRLLLGDARDVLEQAERFEILSLQPTPRTYGPPRFTFLPDRFHGFHVIGRADVAPADRGRLIEALYRGVNESPSLGMGCWEPRHAIRAVRGTRTVDLLICFKCIAVQARGLRVPETGKLVTRKVPITRDPARVFDAALQKLDLRKAGPWAN